MREVREETSLTVTAEHLTGVYYERKGPGFEVLHFAFRCRLLGEFGRYARARFT